MSDVIVSSFANSRSGSGGTLLFSRSDVERLLTPDECIAAVENAFRQHGLGKTQPPGILGLHAEDGGFHIKAALLTLDRAYFAAKTNTNFPHNGTRHALPTIQGVVVLCDAVTGQPLAVMDSIAITALRTAATTAVAASYLARKNSKAALICGCGQQRTPRFVHRAIQVRLVEVAGTATRVAGKLESEWADHNNRRPCASGLRYSDHATP
jgi:ornithine cyclodeaminase/alanine dehydrogenase-like protein (mu-crystallin family)